MSDTPPPEPQPEPAARPSDIPPPEPIYYQPRPEFVPTPEQRVALDAVGEWLQDDSASSPKFFALTGPAGAGKTSVVRQIVKEHQTYSYRYIESRRGDGYEENSPDIGLAALTGKAALRMTALTGLAAKTLHATIYWPPQPGEDLRFTKLRVPAVNTLICDECFEYHQPILTEKGWQWIGLVVNQKRKLRVWARNPATGNLELKSIVRWLKRPAPSSMLQINASRTNSKRDGRQIKCTPEHKILTPGGYVRAGALKVGDEVVVRGLGLTQEQRSVLVGSLLGDGSVTREGQTRTSAQVVLRQGEAQLEYLKFKKTIFGELSSGLQSFPSGYENGKPVWAVRLAVTDDIVRIAKETPPNGKRYESGRQQWSPTDKFMSWIDEQALAVWFLDNGSLQVRENVDGSVSFFASIHSERFDRETHDRFVKVLQDRFGLSAKIQKARGEMMHLRFSKDESEKLLTIVRPFTPTCMNWKTGGIGDYRPELMDQPQTTMAQIRSIKTFNPATKRKPNPSVYDIEVADYHNYVAGNIVVSNCSMITPTLFAHAGEWAAHGVKFLLVGDTFQLPPVISTREVLEKFGEDYSVFSRVKGANLETVMRNAGGVLRAATKIRETGRLPRESDFDDASQTSGYRFVPDTTPITRATDEYVADMKDHMLITWRNETRMRANNRIRALLGRGGELPDPGEPVLIRKNGQGFLNGEIVECVDYEAGPQVDSVRTLWMTVRCAAGDVKILVSFDGGDKEKGGQFFDGSMPWIQNWRNYHATLKREMLPDPTPVTWGYCLTAHTAQGSEARRVTIFLERRDIHSRNFAKQTTLPDGSQATFAARFLYTAVTRAQKLTSMILGT